MSDDNNQDQPKWFIDEGVAGVGDRPSWLPDKFKTAADLAKSHSELEKRLGHVPDEYDFNKSSYIDPDYEPLQDLKKLAKEKRVPQEVFDKMFEVHDKYMDEFRVDVDEEIKKIGDDALNRITTVNNWAKANLSKESYEALSQLRTADGFKALEELRGKSMSNTPQIPGNNGQITNASSLDDIRSELLIPENLAKYSTDKAYREDYSKRLEVAAKNSPGYVDKVGA